MKWEMLPLQVEARRAAREYVDDLGQLEDVKRHIEALQEQGRRLKGPVSRGFGILLTCPCLHRWV